MAFVLTVLYSVLFWLYLLLSSAVFWVVAVLIFLVTLPFDRRRRALHLFSCAWGYQYVWISPFWTATFEGREHIEPGRTYVLVANHQSLADIPLLFGLFKHFKWVSKREIFRLPFIGWNMWMNDYVALARGNRKSIAAMMRHCLKHLERGSSILVFPEGTRSPDGEIQAFKPGALAMAVRADVDVVPIVIDGTHNALPKKSLIFRPRQRDRIHVQVLKPISPSAETSAGALAEELRERMAAALAATRAAKETK